MSRSPVVLVTGALIGIDRAIAIRYARSWQDAPSRPVLRVFALVLLGRPQLCPASGHRNVVSQKLIANSAIPRPGSNTSPKEKR